LQEDIGTNPSVTIDTSIPKTAPDRADLETKVHLLEHLEVEFQNSEDVTPPVSITAESIPSLTPKVFYEPDYLPLPPRLISI